MRHGKVGLHNANELVGRRRETIFAALLVAALACTDMACSKTGLVRNAFIDFWNIGLIFSPAYRRKELYTALVGSELDGILAWTTV